MRQGSIDQLRSYIHLARAACSAVGSDQPDKGPANVRRIGTALPGSNDMLRGAAQFEGSRLTASVGQGLTQPADR